MPRRNRFGRVMKNEKKTFIGAKVELSFLFLWRLPRATFAFLCRFDRTLSEQELRRAKTMHLFISSLTQIDTEMFVYYFSSFLINCQATETLFLLVSHLCFLFREFVFCFSFDSRRYHLFALSIAFTIHLWSKRSRRRNKGKSIGECRRHRP